MNIRNRMERSASRLGMVTATALAAAAGLHGAWARGVTWPRRSPDALADLVVGRRPFPTPAMCWAVTGLLAVSSGGVAAASVGGGRIPLARALSATTGLALLARGAGGLVASGTGLVDATDEFRRHDLAVYSPLCLGLAAGALSAARAS